MTVQQQQLLELLKVVFWEKEPDLCLFADCDWNGVFTLAKDQTVIGFALSGKARLPKDLQPDMKTSLNWVKRLVKIEETNRKMDKAVAVFCKAFEDKGFYPVVLKGQVIARDYPYPEYRQSGDIDVWFPRKDEAEKTFAWAESKFKCKWMPGEKETSFAWSGVVVELHRRIADMQYGPYQKRLQEIIEEEMLHEKQFVVLDGQKVATLPVTLNAFYQIVHLEYHLLNEGVGLRQLCDLAVFLKVHRDEIRVDDLNRYLADTGLENVAAVIGSVLNECLGLDKDFIPFRIDSTYLDLIMDEVWTGGNFGKNTWGWKAESGFLTQKFRAMPLHWSQYRKYRKLLPHEALANFISKFGRATRGVK